MKNKQQSAYISRMEIKLIRCWGTTDVFNIVLLEGKIEDKVDDNNIDKSDKYIPLYISMLPLISWHLISLLYSSQTAGKHIKLSVYLLSAQNVLLIFTIMLFLLL